MKKQYFVSFFSVSLALMSMLSLNCRAKQGCPIVSHSIIKSDTLKSENISSFIDRFLPIPSHGRLSKNVWGASNVIPRDSHNGIESPDFSYWGGNILRGDDGKYHLFVARWPQNIIHREKSGHVCWWDSDVVHAVSDKACGPYSPIDVIGKGHNPEIYRLKDGRYVIGVMGAKAYIANSLNGPWKQIETKFDFIDKKQNETNRTYLMKDDGSILMMNKEGHLFTCAAGDVEHFVEIPNVPVVYVRKNGSHEEDPVIWKDEIGYNLIVNDCRGRKGYYITSKDGLKWNYEEGLAYTPDIVYHEDGSAESWYKLERPKVLLDQYGRVTHMNFAAIDTLKNEDRANDNHSSKNIVVPLLVPRRLKLLNKMPVNESTHLIRVEILAEEGFNPQNDVIISSLRFGSTSVINSGNGSRAIRTRITKDGLLVTFRGKGTGLSDKDYKAKLIGKNKDNKPLFGFVRIIDWE